MFDSEISIMEQYRVRFEKERDSSDPATRATAEEYITALGVFVDAFRNGPGADVERIRHDSTGTLSRVGSHVEWAEAERERMRGWVKELR